MGLKTENLIHFNKNSSIKNNTKNRNSLNFPDFSSILSKFLTFPVCTKFPDWKKFLHFSRFSSLYGNPDNVYKILFVQPRTQNAKDFPTSIIVIHVPLLFATKRTLWRVTPNLIKVLTLAVSISRIVSFGYVFTRHPVPRPNLEGVALFKNQRTNKLPMLHKRFIEPRSSKTPTFPHKIPTCGKI